MQEASVCISSRLLFFVYTFFLDLKPIVTGEVDVIFCWRVPDFLSYGYTLALNLTVDSN